MLHLCSFFLAFLCNQTHCFDTAVSACMDINHFDADVPLWRGCTVHFVNIWTPATRQLGALDTSDYFFRHSIVNNLGRSGHRICVTDCSQFLFYFVLNQPSTPHLFCKLFCNCLHQPVSAPCTYMLFKPLKLCVVLYFYEHTGGCWLKVPLAKYSVQLPSVCTLTEKNFDGWIIPTDWLQSIFNQIETHFRLGPWQEPSIDC